MSNDILCRQYFDDDDYIVKEEVKRSKWTQSINETSIIVADAVTYRYRYRVNMSCGMLCMNPQQWKETIQTEKRHRETTERLCYVITTKTLGAPGSMTQRRTPLYVYTYHTRAFSLPPFSFCCNALIICYLLLHHHTLLQATEINCYLYRL